MEVRRCSALAALALSIASGCAQYHPKPLGSGSDERGTALLQSESMRLRARELKHPILRPIELNLQHGITPDQAAVLAVLLNPALRSVRDQRAIASAQVLTAGILPNPQLTFSEDFPTGGASADAINAYGIGLGWDITQLIAHDARVRAAHAGAASIQLDIAWQEWQAAEAAKIAVYDFIALQQQISLAREIDQGLEKNAELLRRTVARHEKTLVDLAAAEAASQDAHTALLSAERDLRHQRMVMNRAIGLDADVEMEIDPGTTLPSRVNLPSRDELLQGLDDRRLDLIALRRGYESQEQTLRAAILGQFPKINFGVNHARDNTNVKSFGFGLTIDIPVFDHNQGDIALQKATRQQLFDEYAQREYEARSDVMSALDDIRAIQELLAAAEQGIPTEQRLVDAYKKALDQGNVDVLSYYTAISDLQNKRMNVIKLRQQLMENRISIEIATGQYLPDGSGAATTQHATSEPATTPSATTGDVATQPATEESR